MLHPESDVPSQPPKAVWDLATQLSLKNIQVHPIQPGPRGASFLWGLITPGKTQIAASSISYVPNTVPKHEGWGLPSKGGCQAELWGKSQGGGGRAPPCLIWETPRSISLPTSVVKRKLDRKRQ